MIETPTAFSFDDILQVSRVFARSINIRRDFTPEEDEKVAGYIPTLPAENCLKAITEAIHPTATDRVRLVYGPYGGGKSNLGLVIARLVQSGIDYPALEPVIARIANGPRPALAVQLQEGWRTLAASGELGFITVILSGNEGSFHDATLGALMDALEKENLGHLVPKTAYTAARDRIKEWKREYEQAYERLEALLVRHDETVETLDRSLKNGRHDAYVLFCELHPLVAAGARFNSSDLSKAHEVYEAVAKELRRQGYAGIFVVWDEFGSYFEEACRLIRAERGSTELKEIEQFAEMCHGSRDHQVHFLALAHRSLQEYAEIAALGAGALDDWKRISGRFAAPHNLVNTGRQRDSYEVLGRVVQHAPDSRWAEFLACGGREAIERLATEAMRLGLFGQWHLHDLAHVARTCYPLHPATCYILPRLSGAIAQNERTLFTYTSYDEEGSMRAYLREVPPFAASDPATVDVERLFAYFTPALEAERKSVWEQYTLARYEAGGASIARMDERILQVMTIFNAIREQVPTLTVPLCRYSLGLRGEEECALFDDALGRLQELGIIYERETDHGLLFAGRDRQSITKDLDEEMRKIERTHNPVAFLRDRGGEIGSVLLPVQPIEPTEYHTRHKTRRLIQAHLVAAVDEAYIRSLSTTLTTQRDQVDGLLLFVIAETAQELEQARHLITGGLASERTLFVIPAVPLTLRPHTLQLEALANLRARGPYSDGRSGLAQLADDRRTSVRRKLEEQLRPLLKIAHQGGQSTVYLRGEAVSAITAYEDIEDYASELLARVYKLNLAIDDEGLSTRITTKNQWSGSGKARRAVVNQILRFDTLGKNERESLGFAPTAQEYRYVRGLLMACGYLDRTVTTWMLGRPKRETATAAAAVYDAITEHFFGKEGQARSVKALVQKLSGPPYGLYSASLPLLIAVAIRERASQLQFFKNDKPVNDRTLPLSDLLMDMCLEPSPYTFTNRPVSQDIHVFIEQLMTALGRRARAKEGDLIAECATALRVWISDEVTAYGRKTTRLSPEAKAVRDVALEVEGDSFRKIALDLPQRLGLESDLGRAVTSEEARGRIGAVLGDAVREVATCHNYIDGQVIDVMAALYAVSSENAEAVFRAVSRAILERVDAADPRGVDTLRPHILTLLLWAEHDHGDAAAAFGELALKLVGKTSRAAWADADIEIVRAKLVTMKDLMEGLASAEAPVTGVQRAFLGLLVSALDGDRAAVEAADDPLVEAERAARTWYQGLSDYARETRELRQDTEALRDVLKGIGRTPTRQLLLDILPQRLGLSDALATLETPETAERVRRRIQEVATRLRHTQLAVDTALAEVVAACAKLSKGSPEHVLAELRVYAEGKAASVDGALPEVVRRFLTVIRRDEPARDVFRALGRVYVGTKEDSRWTDRDVALAAEEMRAVIGAIGALAPAKTTQRTYRIAVTVGGHQTEAEIQYHDMVESAAVLVEERIMELLKVQTTRDESKLLGVAKVLNRLLEKKQRR